jgi:hypothetical protein
MSAVGKAPTMGSEIRKCVAASAKDLGETASEYGDQVRIRVVDAVEELASRGQKTREVDRSADAAAKAMSKH